MSAGSHGLTDSENCYRKSYRPIVYVGEQLGAAAFFWIGGMEGGRQEKGSHFEWVYRIELRDGSFRSNIQEKPDRFTLSTVTISVNMGIRADIPHQCKFGFLGSLSKELASENLSIV